MEVVNKMIVADNDSREYEYIYGNTAYDYRKKEYKDINKKNRELNRKNYINSLKKKVKSLAICFIMMIMSTIIVGRYATIINLNQQNLALKKNISENRKINEDLKLQLMKYENIKEINEVATNNLNMIRPDTVNIIHIRLDSTPLDLNNKEDIPDSSITIIDKIKVFINKYI